MSPGPMERVGVRIPMSSSLSTFDSQLAQLILIPNTWLSCGLRWYSCVHSCPHANSSVPSFLKHRPSHKDPQTPIEQACKRETIRHTTEKKQHTHTHTQRTHNPPLRRRQKAQHAHTHTHTQRTHNTPPQSWTLPQHSQLTSDKRQN